MAGMAPHGASQTLTVRSPAIGWLLPLDTAPDPAFASGALGEGVTIELLDDKICAPCDGRVAAIALSRHAVTIETAGGARLLIHCGIDTVTLDGEPFSLEVEEGQEVEAGDILLRVKLEMVVAAGKSLNTPMVLIEPAGHSLTLTRSMSALIEPGDPLFTLHIDPAGAASETGQVETTCSCAIELPLPHGLHARPSATIAAEAARWNGPIRIIYENRVADARSTTGLMKLGAAHRASLIVEAGGPEAEKALQAIVDLIASGAGDEIGKSPAEPRYEDTIRPLKPVPDTQSLKEKSRLHGVPAAPGQTLGPAYFLTRARLEISEKSQGTRFEKARLDDALDQLHAELVRDVEESLPGIAAAHLAILNDEPLLAAVAEAIEDGRSAAAAWQYVMSQEAASLRALTNERLAERADDFTDLEQQVLRILTGESTEISAPKGAVVIARDLYPSDLAPLAEAGIAGIATMAGGPTSHLAILAASAGIPMAVAFGKPLCKVEEGEIVHLDGGSGQLRHHLSPEVRSRIAESIESQAAVYAQALATTHEDTCLASGERIEIFANLGSVADAEEALSLGAEGSGLLRTEFLFLDRPSPPTQAEQTAIYSEIMDRFDGKPVIIRTLDIGADKPAPYLQLEKEDNPALGIRGIRVGSRYPDLLETQLRAILTAAGNRPCHIMVPMVASTEEIAALRRVLHRVCLELKHTGRVNLGAMIETPASALIAQHLADALDFLSVGTNDLTQYALAMDRTNPELAAMLDPMHPAVIRLIAMAGKAASLAECFLGVCGNAAGDPVAAPVLIGLGATELSVSAARIPELKQLLRRLTLKQCQAAANAALSCSTAQEARTAARQVIAEQVEE